MYLVVVVEYKDAIKWWSKLTYLIQMSWT